MTIVTAPAAAAQVHAIAHQHGVAADELGHAVADPDQSSSYNILALRHFW